MLKIWKQWKLTIKNNITVVNILALFSLIYVYSLIETHQEAIKEINDIIQNIICDGKTAEITQNTLVKMIEYNGLKLCHCPTKVNSLEL